MGRLRLGVVLLVPDPAATEIDGLRRACGDSMFGRVPSHVTLVPPVNVRVENLPEALAAVRAAAAAQPAPLTLTVGPVASFLPDTPVVYLRVHGEPGAAEAVHALHGSLFRPPLARPIAWPFVPHVTLADQMDPARIPDALAALAEYEVEVTVHRLHVLREDPDRVWRPVADAGFGPPAVVGRGGLPVELAVGALVDPDAAATLNAAEGAPARPAGAEPLVVTARRPGHPAVLGVLAGWTRDGAGLVTSVSVVREARDEGVSEHLVAAALSAAADRDCRLDRPDESLIAVV